MYKLKYIGFLETPGECPDSFEEYAYDEVVQVKNGIAFCNLETTRDLLTKFGYIDITNKTFQEFREEIFPQEPTEFSGTRQLRQWRKKLKEEANNGVTGS